MRLTDTSHERQRRRFDEHAAIQDQRMFRDRWPRNQERKTALLAEELGAATEGAVLELGCGTGHIGAALLGEHPRLRYVGVDLSPGMVEGAAKRLEPYGERGSAAVAVGEALDFADDSFDGAFGVDVLHHVADPVASLAELARVVRPGGTVVFLEGNPRFPVTTWIALTDPEERVLLTLSRKRLRRWYEQAGLREVDVRLGPLFTPPGPTPLVPVYDRIDAVLAAVPGLRALALFYVARGRVSGGGSLPRGIEARAPPP